MKGMPFPINTLISVLYKVKSVTLILNDSLGLIRGGFKKFEEKCCQICNGHEKFTFSVYDVN